MQGVYNIIHSSYLLKILKMMLTNDVIDKYAYNQYIIHMEGIYEPKIDFKFRF
jgi:hypothetical protein